MPSIPGPFTGAEIFVLGELLKRADLQSWIDGLVNNDTLYGGLGDDFLHGGEGSDAMSGAEAMQEFYNRDLRSGTHARLATELPLVDTNPLHYDPVTTKFAQYDADDPRSIIPGFLLNFDAYVLDEGPVRQSTSAASRSRATTAGTGSTATSGTTGSWAAPTATGCSAGSATICCSSTTTSRPPAAPTRTPRTTTRDSATATSLTVERAATC